LVRVRFRWGERHWRHILRRYRGPLAGPDGGVEGVGDGGHVDRLISFCPWTKSRLVTHSRRAATFSDQCRGVFVGDIHGRSIASAPGGERLAELYLADPRRSNSIPTSISGESRWVRRKKKSWPLVPTKSEM